jgi:hypothetical protein
LLYPALRVLGQEVGFSFLFLGAAFTVGIEAQMIEVLDHRQEFDTGRYSLAADPLSGLETKPRPS